MFPGPEPPSDGPDDPTSGREPAPEPRRAAGSGLSPGPERSTAWAPRLAWLTDWVGLRRDPGPDVPLGIAIRAILGRDALAVLEQEAAACRGEVEGIHQMRRAIRRLRGSLHLFAPVLDAEWTGSLQHELRELGRELGSVRDLDVHAELFARLAADSKLRPRPLLEPLRLRRTLACEVFRRHLTAPETRPLSQRLGAVAYAPVREPEAGRPCGAQCVELLRPLWRRLARAGLRIDASAPQTSYHDLRKRAKELRHAATVVQPWLPPDSCSKSRRLARRMGRLLDPLGHYQDAVLALEYLADPSRSTEAALLRVRLESQAQLARERSRHAWRRIADRRRPRWLRG